MPRRGRDLEELVRDLENVLADTPVQVRSPEFIVGKHSGSRREVDVSIRANVGSVEMLGIFECRKRKHKQDVTWIEGLATKKNDVGANHAVAVSSTPFSTGAISLASVLGIELRTFSEVETLVVDWVDAFLRNQRNLSVEYSPSMKLRTQDGPPSDPNEPATVEFSLDLNEPRFSLPDGSMLSFDQAFFQYALDAVVANIPIEAVEWAPTFSADFEDADARYRIDVDGHIFEVVKLEIAFRVTVVPAYVVAEKSYRYDSNKGTLSNSFKATHRFGALEVNYTIHDSSSGAYLEVSRADTRPDREFRMYLPASAQEVEQDYSTPKLRSKSPSSADARAARPGHCPIVSS